MWRWSGLEVHAGAASRISPPRAGKGVSGPWEGTPRDGTVSVTALDELSAPDDLERRLEGSFQTKGGGYGAGGIRGVFTSAAFGGGCCARGRGMMRAAGHGRVLPCRAAAQPKEARAKLQDAGKNFIQPRIYFPAYYS